MSELLTSPWLPTFKALVREATTELSLVAPFITSWPLSWVGQEVAGRPVSPQVSLMTDFNLVSLQSGSLSVAAVDAFMRLVPEVRVIHVPRLHAKTYLNSQTAIVTSGNLTANGLLHNVEYGVRLTTKKEVEQVRQQVLNLEQIGSRLSSQSIQAIAACVGEVQSTIQQQASRPQRSILARLLTQQQQNLSSQVLAGRTETESVEGIFRRTLLAVLRWHGPSSTQSIHGWMMQLQPDLCDESLNRVINGVSFGRKWKHQVRSAQAGLKRAGLVSYSNGLWQLTE